MNFNRRRYGLWIMVVMGLLVACGSMNQNGPTAGEIMQRGQDSVDAVPLAEQESAFSAADEVVDNEVEEILESPPAEQSVAAVSITKGDKSEESYEGLPAGFTEDGHPYIGNVNAPVVIEEYSDYQCPYCTDFYHQTLGGLKEQAVANGEAVIVYYDFPLSFHPQAEVAANAARCAGEQGAAAYWGMHDALFENVQSWSNDNANQVFKQLAADLEVDGAQFAECVDSFRYQNEIQADIARGRANGVSGTPSFFLNGQLLVGAQPLQAFQQALVKVQAGESIVEERSTVTLDEVDIPPFEMPQPVQLNDEYAAVIGSPDAPITIVEFSDYQCPYCGRHFAETIPTIMSQMVETGRVKYVFKDFPLDQIHPDAREAAEAARCAGEQDAYWAMHDHLFRKQELWSGQADLGAVFTGYAAELALDEAAFSTCYDSGRHAEAVQANYNEGLGLNVTGTPAFFINGYFISGARPYELFELLVNGIETDTLEELYHEAYDQQVEAYKQELAQQQVQEQRADTPIDVPIDNSPTIGDPNAPIIIIEYTDFQCPYCSRHFAETFPQIKENYVDKGLVRYVFKDFPLSIHPQAQIAAEAARCADEQRAFLAMHDLLFANQNEWGDSGARDIFIEYATRLNLDVDMFTGCLDGGKYQGVIAADLDEGISIGVTGTPSFVINGQLVVGALPYSSFDQALQQLLSQVEAQ